MKERKLRIMTVSALFPPNVIGGAEISAFNLAKWLADNGHDVGVLTAATSLEDEVSGELDQYGLKIWRRYMPRVYPIIDFPNQPGWRKPIWHIQDHFHPGNRAIVSEVLDEFDPDFVNLHYVQGIGYNSLIEISRRKIPVNFMLHDMGLACVRMNMFKNGSECKGHCVECKLSTAYKKTIIDRFESINFVSPSKANLDAVAGYIPAARRSGQVVLNCNKYPIPDRPRIDSGQLKILYVGRIHPSKGVDVLLEAAERLVENYKFSLTVVGGGGDDLKEKYANRDWCKFAGKVSQQEVANYMSDSNVLCIPSIWLENSPGVVIHALQLGLPVLGSDKGGIPELIQHEHNGLLVEPGNIDEWMGALERVLSDASLLSRLSNNAQEQSERFSQDSIGAVYLDLIRNSIFGNAHD